MIGSLLYVTTSRLDVMQVVGQVTCFQEAPKESHVLAIKRIFRYLKGTKEFGLWYPKGKYLSLVAYTDANWASFIDDRRSTSGESFYMGECLVSWLRKKQSSISLSIQGIIHCNNNLLYSSSLDEADIAGYASEV
jgi:hypothetical protein